MTTVLRLSERVAAFAAVWWVLSEGEPSSWAFGVPFVVLASVAALRLTPERGWGVRPLGLLRFAALFFGRSLIGGIDVAWRAVRPSMPVTPAFVSYPVRLPTEASRVLLANTVSLLPGTLSSGFEDDLLVMHVLDETQPIIDEVRHVEERIAGALGLELGETPSGEAGGGVT